MVDTSRSRFAAFVTRWRIGSSKPDTEEAEAEKPAASPVGPPPVRGARQLWLEHNDSVVVCFLRSIPKVVGCPRMSMSRRGTRWSSGSGGPNGAGVCLMVSPRRSSCSRQPVVGGFG